MTDAMRWLSEGNAHYEAGRWNEACSAFERALELDPRQAGAWYRLGNAREELGQNDLGVAVCFEKAVGLDPSHAQAWNNLGNVQQRLGRTEQAIASYRNALRAEPGLAPACLNLGRLAEARGDQALALECFRTGLKHHPEDPIFEHLAAAAAGLEPARPPGNYVASLFDGLAARFESHLVQDLKYQIPQALGQMVRPQLEAVRGAAAPARVIDLGCGTGLVGLALAATGAEITGVDLSQRMLEIAARRGVYAKLEQGELIDVLARTAAGSAQAVLAADVFIYIGDLAPVFAAVARVLAPGGLFALSAEGIDEGTYHLQPSGRYSHAPAYLRALAAQSGLEERRLERATLRREGRGNAEGWLALFAKAGGGTAPTAA
jgi:predicted TPR repeat methyltransferase